MRTMIDWLINLVRLLPDSRFNDWLIRWLMALKQLFFYDGMMFHYGCPNSKRTAKLQLKKRIFHLK